MGNRKQLCPALGGNELGNLANILFGKDSAINLLNKNIGIIVSRYASNKHHITLPLQGLGLIKAYILKMQNMAKFLKNENS
jgi:hypothetical protein